MYTLQEMMGGIGEALFVPASVVKSQKETQANLEARAQALNSNVPQTLAIAQTSGTLSDGQAKSALQQMNQSLFLVNDSQRALGEQIEQNLIDSAANSPAVLIDYAKNKVLVPAGNAVRETTQSLVPWQIWLILGLAVVVAVGIFSFVKAKT